MVIIAIEALEMVGIDGNIPNRTSSVTFFLLVVGWFFGVFTEDFGMSYAEKVLVFFDK